MTWSSDETVARELPTPEGVASDVAVNILSDTIYSEGNASHFCAHAREEVTHIPLESSHRLLSNSRLEIIINKKKRGNPS